MWVVQVSLYTPSALSASSLMSQASTKFCSASILTSQAKDERYITIIFFVMSSFNLESQVTSPRQSQDLKPQVWVKAKTSYSICLCLMRTNFLPNTQGSLIAYMVSTPAWGNLPPDNTNLVSEGTLGIEESQVDHERRTHTNGYKQLHNLREPVQNEDRDPLFRTVRTSRWRQQKIKAPQALLRSSPVQAIHPPLQAAQFYMFYFFETLLPGFQLYSSLYKEQYMSLQRKYTI